MFTDFPNAQTLIAQFDDSVVKNRAPFTVSDSVYHREWLLPNPVRYYIAQTEEGWFACDRITDMEVPGTGASTRKEAIRLFYKLRDRSIPEGDDLPVPPGVRRGY